MAPEKVIRTIAMALGLLSAWLFFNDRSRAPVPEPGTYDACVQTCRSQR